MKMNDQTTAVWRRDRYSRRWCVSMVLLLAGLCVNPSRAFSAGNERSVRVGGDVSNPGDWTVKRLKQQFAAEIRQIHYASQGQPHVSNCVALLSLLKAAGAPTELKMDPAADPKMKNAPLRIVIVIQGRDGYTVVFSLPELLSQIGNKPVWLALDEDGGPLSERDGPVKLVVPDDAKPARGVHGIAAVRVEDMGHGSH